MVYNRIQGSAQKKKKEKLKELGRHKFILCQDACGAADEYRTDIECYTELIMKSTFIVHYTLANLR